jgi:hypothetical protein
MSKIVMSLHLPEPKIRKRAVRAVQKHRDKSKYTRKQKHKAIGFPPVALCFCRYTRVQAQGIRVPRQTIRPMTPPA